MEIFRNFVFLMSIPDSFRLEIFNRFSKRTVQNIFYFSTLFNVPTDEVCREVEKNA